MSKHVKETESVIQVSFQSTAVFTLLHFEIADSFAVKQLHTYYIKIYYIKFVYF